ncbi:MAG: ABC transporter ATP-binding protein [Planctomycetota bacterium]
MLLQVDNLQKHFTMGEQLVKVLDGLDLQVEEGEFLAIEGRSGEGKSTLLHLLGALDEPDGGTITFDGNTFKSLGRRGRARVRNRDFGFVFQFYHLLPELNVRENTLLAASVDGSMLGRHDSETKRRALSLLEAFGLSDRLNHRPAQLSGGERQRVAIARALMNRPRILFADEPTGNLDAATGRQIMDVVADLYADRGQTIVMVTHDRSLAKTADRALLLREGKLVAAPD